MKLIFAVAWRNVWRNSRRSIVTMAAMAFALTMMILYSGLLSGWLLGMRRNMLDVELGYVQVFSPAYRHDPSIYERIEAPEPLLRSLRAHGFGASGRLLAAGLAAANETSTGVSVRGIDVANDVGASSIHEYVANGKWLRADRPREVVVGRKLALSLGATLGDELVLLSQGADGSVANDLYHIRGILKGVSDEVDRAGIFMTAAAFRELFVVPTGVHQILIRKPPDMDLDTAKAQIEKLAPALDVKTWKELLPTMASMFQSTESMVWVVFLIVYIAIGIILLNAMLMAVFERIREFGVLKALGFSPAAVLSIVLLESALQTVVATVVGLLLCWPAGHYLSVHGIDLRSVTDSLSVMGVAWDPIWRAHFTTDTVKAPIITLYAVVLLAVLYPASKAALVPPVEAMRHT